MKINWSAFLPYIVSFALAYHAYGWQLVIILMIFSVAIVNDPARRGPPGPMGPMGLQGEAGRDK